MNLTSRALPEELKSKLTASPTLISVLNPDGSPPACPVNILYIMIGKYCVRLSGDIGVSLFIYGFKNYARGRQLRNYSTKVKPHALEKVKAVKDDDFKKAQAHSKDVLAFKMY